MSVAQWNLHGDLIKKNVYLKKKKIFSHNLKHFSSKFIIKLEKNISLNAG